MRRGAEEGTPVGKTKSLANGPVSGKAKETVTKAGKVVIIAAGIGWGWEYQQELMQINRCVARPQMKELHKNFITRPVFQATSLFVLNSRVLITHYSDF